MTAIKTTGRVICGRCRHPRPLHSNGETACRARGCHSGPNEGPCQGFVAEAEVAEGSSVLAPQFRAPEFGGLPAAASG